MFLVFLLGRPQKCLKNILRLRSGQVSTIERKTLENLW
jgi:hypothetical protein